MVSYRRLDLNLTQKMSKVMHCLCMRLFLWKAERQSGNFVTEICRRRAAP
jgi:hypothetical protein